MTPPRGCVHCGAPAVSWWVFFGGVGAWGYCAAHGTPGGMLAPPHLGPFTESELTAWRVLSS